MMRFFHILFKVLILLLLSNYVHSKTTKKPKTPKVNTKSEKTTTDFKYVVTSAEWMAMMSRELPSAFCDSKEYYAFCFDADKATCGATVQRIAGRCYKRISIPKSIRLSTQGVDLGQILGRCVGSEYERQMQTKRRPAAVCKESRQWF